MHGFRFDINQNIDTNNFGVKSQKRCCSHPLPIYKINLLKPFCIYDIIELMSLKLNYLFDKRQKKRLEVGQREAIAYRN